MVLVILKERGDDLEDKDKLKRFTLRLSDELHDNISEAAKEDMRSMHAEILMLIQEGLKARKIPKESRREGLNQAAA
jgi:hypothetical protein